MPSRGSDIGPADSGAPATRWYPSVAAARIPAARDLSDATFWLTLEGSMTRALRARCESRFQVEILREGYARPTSGEARALGLPTRQLAWIREVQLCGDGEPWVTARTVIPLPTLRGNGRRLRHLGRQPLGAQLFRHQRWERGPFHIGLTQQTTADQPVIGRRSHFTRGRYALLVNEFFHRRLLERTARRRVQTGTSGRL